MFKKIGIALGCAFALAAMPNSADYAHAARDTEPLSCKAGGRVYAPEESSVTVDAATGEILSGDRIDEPRYPASMVKMMTAALIFDALRDGTIGLQDLLAVRHSADVLATKGNSRSTWLEKGELLSVEEAILAIAVASANNVAVLMAEKLAGSEADFVRLMNQKAQEIGMQGTIFKNASGLPDRQQVSTARDMAKLALYIFHEYPEFYSYFSAPRAEFGSWRGSRAKVNHNELVMKNPAIDGLKTGFICDAGYNLAASAADGGTRVISIVFGGRTPERRNAAAAALLKDALAMLAKRAQGTRVAVRTLGYIDDDLKTRKAENAPSPPAA